MFNRNAFLRGAVASLLVAASTNLYAASTTYAYTITGDVLSGDEWFSNAFNLTVGETITAYGTFTVDSSYAASGGAVSFGTGSGNTMTIDLNGTLLSASDDTHYATGFPTLTFTSGWTLSVFDYVKTSAPSFDSAYLAFSDYDSLYGEWQTTAAVTAVPEAETYAMMLAGLGLVGFMGAARKKSLQAAV